jgi:hypothetical protein
MRLNTSVKGQRLSITYHALDRYIERVRNVWQPSEADRGRYSHELCHLIRKHATISHQPPKWHPEEESADLWILVGEDIAFPAVTRGRSTILLSCLTRGGFSDERRALRNKVNADRRASIRASRAHDSWRGERSPRWN